MECLAINEPKHAYETDEFTMKELVDKAFRVRRRAEKRREGRSLAVRSYGPDESKSPSLFS